MGKALDISKENQQLIKEAVQDLELESSGELVLYLAKDSSKYQSGKWILSSILGVLGAILVPVLGYFWLLPSGITILEVCMLILSLMLVGFLITWISPGMRASLLGKSFVHNKVMGKAHRVFLEKEVFQTVDRTGILIYISALEKEVVVLGDTGISSVVKPEDWEEVVSHIIQGIKNKDVSAGILQAVKDCKKLLLDNKFKVRPDDTNELPDEITIES